MIVNVYTFCYNEMNILPFVVDYLETYADHVYVLLTVKNILSMKVNFQ